MILDGFRVSKEMQEKSKKTMEQLKKKNIFPCLVVIEIGENTASDIYVRNKKIACETVGIIFRHLKFPKSITKDALKKEISSLNEDNSVNGILIQSPLPKTFDETEIFNFVNPSKDVDGFTNENLAKIITNQNGLTPCTPTGILKLLEEYQISLEGKHVVIIGRSRIVGLPMSLMALNENASVTILHSKSKNIEEITKTADVIICAVGKPDFLTENMVKENAVVIDVGINQKNGHLVGDVDYEPVSKKTSFITPVPKGVGPMTIAALIDNVIKSSQK